MMDYVSHLALALLLVLPVAAAAPEMPVGVSAGLLGAATYALACSLAEIFGGIHAEDA